MTRPKIAVWGPSQVGKSTFLAGSLLSMQTQPLGWNWLLGGDGDEHQRTFDFIQYEIAQLERGDMIAATGVAKPDHYIFKFTQDGNFLGTRGRYHEVDLIDVAGILTEDEEDINQYFETLCQCQGILMMVDPNIQHGSAAAQAIAATESYYVLINRLIHHLQKTRLSGVTLDIPLAICLTKMEQNEHWAYRDRGAEYLQTILGRASYHQLINTFSTKEFFAVSAVGRFQHQTRGEIPNIDESGARILNIMDWQPYRLLDPLFWLFDQLEESRDKRLSWWRRYLRRRLREANYIK